MSRTTASATATATATAGHSHRRGRRSANSVVVKLTMRSLIGGTLRVLSGGVEQRRDAAAEGRGEKQLGNVRQARLPADHQSRAATPTSSFSARNADIATEWS